MNDSPTGSPVAAPPAPVRDSATPSYVVKDTRPAPNKPLPAPDEIKDIYDPVAEPAAAPKPLMPPSPVPPTPLPLPSVPPAPVPERPVPAQSDTQYVEELAAVSQRLAVVAEKLNSAAEHLAEHDTELVQALVAPTPAVAGTQANSGQAAAGAAAPPSQLEPASEAVLDGTEYRPSPGENRGMFGLFTALAILVGVVIVADQKPVVWLSLLGLNVVGTVGFNLMLRRLPWVHKDDWFTAAVLQTGMVIPFLFKEIVKPIDFPHYSPLAMELLALGVLCMVALQFCNVRALKNLEASVFSVVFNTRIIFATIFGSIILGETIPGMEILGGLLIFASIFIVRQRGSKQLTAQGFAYGLGAALSMSIMNTCEKKLIKLVGYEQYVFPMFCMAAIVMWTIVVMKPGRVRLPVKLILKPQSLLLMSLRACAAIGFSYSLVFGPVAVSSYVSSLSVVLLVIFGMVFLGEKDYFKAKLAAAASALAGLTLILIDRLGG